MLSEVCRYLNNWFVEREYFGDFTIMNGALETGGMILQEGQYFRIVDSVFNDGVYKNPHAFSKDETFHGAVWTMKVPKEIEGISAEIDEWKAKYLNADGAAMSPYTSESFGGYSYTKAAGGAADGSGSWQTVPAFTSRLDGWRKPRCRY